MILLGSLVSTEGLDIYDGTARDIFGRPELIDDLSPGPVAMGLFGVSEIILSVRSGRAQVKHKITLRSMLPTRDDRRRMQRPMLRRAGHGCQFGPLPGTGPSVAALASCATERRVGDEAEAFGQSRVEGILGPEASNNATVRAAFTPTPSLAVPGTPPMAIMIGGLMIHGIVPGPLLIQNGPELFSGLVASFGPAPCCFWFSTPVDRAVGGVSQHPYRPLDPGVVARIEIGSYSISNASSRSARCWSSAWSAKSWAARGFRPRRCSSVSC